MKEHNLPSEKGIFTKDKIGSLLIWNATILFAGLVGHLSLYELTIMFFGAWLGVIIWYTLHVHTWLFPQEDNYFNNKELTFEIIAHQLNMDSEELVSEYYQYQSGIYWKVPPTPEQQKAMQQAWLRKRLG